MENKITETVLTCIKIYCKCRKYILKKHAALMVVASSVVYCGFEPWSDQTKDHKIGLCYFSAMHAALWSKSKDWLARKWDIMSKWSNISTRELSFQ